MSLMVSLKTEWIKSYLNWSGLKITETTLSLKSIKTVILTKVTNQSSVIIASI